jgi:hypothetical protein
VGQQETNINNFTLEQREDFMFKKRVFSLILVVMLLVIWIFPASADKPDRVKLNIVNHHYVTDCSPFGYNFKVYNEWQESEIFFTYYNKDGDYDHNKIVADMLHTFSTIPDTGKTLSNTSHTILFVVDPVNAIWEFRGIFQRIIVPGKGPIFIDAGRKLFYGWWMDDGSLLFELIENAGPSTYTSNDFETLCDYLAP